MEFGNGEYRLNSAQVDPKNLQWIQDRYTIRIAEAGLYEINLAFFTKAKPSVQIVVNGESVLSAINSPSYVVQHSSGYVMDGNGRLEQGTVTGISLVVLENSLRIFYHFLLNLQSQFIITVSRKASRPTGSSD
jgi:hypothetical protein